MKKFVEHMSEGIMMKSQNTIDNPEDPEVMVPGFGSMLLSQLRNSVARQLTDVGKRASRNDFDIAYSLLLDKSGAGAVVAKLQAIKDAEEEMKKSPYKRKITLAKKR